jgi:hypothetical protein
MQYIKITTLFDVYKCHGYRRKNDRIYFNSRAINVANVVSIVLKDGTVAYNNDKLTVMKPVRVCAHHVSTLKGADKCKPTKKQTVSSIKRSNLPDIIEI